MAASSGVAGGYRDRSGRPLQGLCRRLIGRSVRHCDDDVVPQASTQEPVLGRAGLQQVAELCSGCARSHGTVPDRARPWTCQRSRGRRASRRGSVRSRTQRCHGRISQVVDTYGPWRLCGGSVDQSWSCVSDPGPCPRPPLFASIRTCSDNGLYQPVRFSAVRHDPVNPHSGRRGPRFKSGQPDHRSAGNQGVMPRSIRISKLLSRFCRDRQFPWP